MTGLPPNSIEAEQGVLACILQSPPDCIERCVTELPPDGSAFYDRRHQDLFRSLVEMHEKRRPIDLITVCAHLNDCGIIENCGGSVYVSELQDKTPSPANLPTYLEIVLDKWQRRRVISTCHDIVETTQTSTSEIAEILDRAQGQILAVGKDASCADDTITGADFARLGMSVLEDRKHGHTRAIPTGFLELDGFLNGGFKPGQLVVIAGRPSTGKTAFGMQIAANAAEKHPVGVFSLEMSPEELSQRELARESQNDLRAFDPAMFLDEQTQKAVAVAAHRIKSRQMYINVRPDQTVQRIRGNVRRWRHREKVELVVVDYLQLIQSSRNARDRREAVDEIARGLKIVAKELDIVIVALAQLNRESDKENRKPRLSDLRESGAIEQDADVVLLMYRRAGSDGDPDPSRIGCLIAKQRNGPTQRETYYHFDGPVFRFTEQPTKIPHEP